MHSKSTLAAGAALAGLVLASCDDSGMGPDSMELQIAATAAAVAADAVLEDLSLMNDALPRPGGLASMGGLPAALERERTAIYYDGSGQEQSAFEETTTASMHILATISGDISRENLSASVERHRDMWVTGLEGDEEIRTWNGIGSGENNRARVHDDLGERTYHAVSTSLIQDVLRPVDRETHPWPLSGTIIRTVAVTITNGPNGDVSRERTVVVAFDGSQFATLTVNGEDPREVDLEAREGRNPLRRKRP